MAGIAIITEACIDVKDRACVDVCPVQCIYEFDPQKNILFSEEQAGSGEIENSHTPSLTQSRNESGGIVSARHLHGLTSGGLQLATSIFD